MRIGGPDFLQFSRRVSLGLLGLAQLGLLLSLVSGMAIEQRAAAHVYGNEELGPMDRRPGRLHAPIGLLRNSGDTASGTGFLIDECHVLTAQHVEFNEKPWPPQSPKLTFYVGHGEHRGFAKAVGATVVLFGFYEAKRLRNHIDDWMLLRLDDCGASDSVGKVYGTLQMELTRAPDLEDANLETAGFPYSKDETEGAVDGSCTVRKGYLGTLMHDCAALAGNSGSPILRAVKDAMGRTVRYRVVGMQTKAKDGIASEWTPMNSNIGLSLYGFQYIFEDRVAPKYDYAEGSRFRSVRPVSTVLSCLSKNLGVGTALWKSVTPNGEASLVPKLGPVFQVNVRSSNGETDVEVIGRKKSDYDLRECHLASAPR